jgi:hypothetical protein
MSHESIRIISSNTYRNRALRDQASLEYLLPQDGVPTITAFQEATPSRDARTAIRERNYRALWSPPHGLALALSPDVGIDDLQTLVYPNRNPQRKWGLQVLRTKIGDRDVILGNGHAPIFISRSWSSVVAQDAQAFGKLVGENPDSLVFSLGDRNHLTQKQRHIYTGLQAWGVPLVPDTMPTYRLSEGKHRLLGWLGMADPQLDGIHAYVPECMELTNTKEAAGLGATQVGYEVETHTVASDHLAVQALIRVPYRLV